MRKLFLRVAPVLACLFAAACAPSAATLVLHHGNIITLDSPSRARAIAIKGDRIVAVGTDEEIERFIGTHTLVIDLHGQTATPGLIEGHGHLMGLGDSLRSLDLTTAKNWDEVVAMVAAAAKNAKPGEWITGRGWHQEKWDAKPVPDVQGFPVHDALSKVSPNNPVLLTHASNHAAMVNAKAMELAGITATTAAPGGGVILKDANGIPTGLLGETAAELPAAALAKWLSLRSPAEQQADVRQKIDLAIQEALSHGITSFQDAGEDFAAIDQIKLALRDNALGVRLWVMALDSNENLRAKMPYYKAIGLGDHRLTIAAIKKHMDGALGSRGAWMLEDYSDLPGHTGLNRFPLSEMEETARIALDNDVQFCVHAIGDRANHEVLNIFEAAFKSRPGATDLRWRIEHAQHLNPADIPRFAQLGVIASMQTIHCTSDAPFVIARLGEKRAAEGAYVWQKLIQSGAVVSNGTDTPVERINPIPNFYAAVTRKLKDGSTFFPDQCMTRQQALASMTLIAAYAAKEEKIKGSLTPGKLADITVLSQDLLTIPDEQILNTKVIYTIVGGKIAFATFSPGEQAP